MSDDNLVNPMSDAVDVLSGARWQRIAQVLRDEIAGGTLAAGTRLPNESALAQRFGVHRHTLRQAMRQLAHEGFVQVRQGAGTFVRDLVLDYALQRRTRLSENLARHGESGQRERLAHGVDAAGEWAPLLDVDHHAPVEWLDARIVVRGRPLALSRTCYPLPRLAGLCEAFAATGSISAALARLGVSDYVRRSSRIGGRVATPEEADRLARPANAPVLVVEFVNVDTVGLPVEAGRTVFAADAVQLTVDHTR